MTRPLEGKFGIITGGSRGIGEAIAQNLASKGASLLLNYTSESSRARTETLCADLQKAHSITCLAVQADLSQPVEATETILSFAKTHFSKTGSLQIDILINNAGVSKDRTLNDPASGPIDPAYFNWQYTVNVLAPLLLTQACAPYLPANRGGRIVNISSVSATMGFEGQSVYGGTKAALEAMTRTWARELADKATVNAISPGPVIGDMYFGAGEGFWSQIQGFMDNTPLSKVLAGDEKMEALTGEQRALIAEKMGGRRPAFTGEIAGVVVHLRPRTIFPTSSYRPIRQFPTPIAPIQSRTLATTSSGKSQADLCVEELQDLYETAKDEFEIATESTDNATIYAASDRESARDALNQLVGVYSLYTSHDIQSYEESHQPQQAQPDDGGSVGLPTYLDPAEIAPKVREEVKKRVGQRIRELENAIEGLEERAKED
ncbi:hypothetical protein BDV25DRAFT_142793 [Aspergillus avenaceus]|uniref:3-oxoacyl-reductase n=1 Tax=Aspergillus avenaceus TaxID=36643 RepID=A0A5N6TM34_ASPAV|nr:hypothetical protein BDV25DRAFT_142793 [Aspergillus avenaceus]